MLSHRTPTETPATEDITVIIEEQNSKGEVVEKYIKGRFLGKGGFAKCYEFTTVESKRLYASKVITKASLTKNRAKQKLMSEIKIHRSLHHTNVVHLEHFFEDKENVYILLEMCSNNTMSDLVKRRKRLTELEVRCYMTQILSALKYLHKHQVIHRDLKLGNIFLSDQMEIKLGDFGLATKLEYEGEKKRTICGTPNYIAPEILEGKHGHSYEVDIWSLGVILYTFLIGKPPFETTDVKTTYRRIRMCSYSFPDNVLISSQAKNLITKILATDPSKRPSLDEISNHEFFTMGGPIPKLLPVSTLACPPSSSYIRQYMSSREREHNENKSSSPKRFEITAPASAGLKPSLNERRDFINTDRSGKNSSASNMTPSTNTQAHPAVPRIENLYLVKPSYSDKPVIQSAKNQYSLHTMEDQRKSIKEEHGGTSRRELLEENAAHINNLRLKSPLKGSPLHSNSNQVGSANYLTGSDVYVKKWVDYSSKYGMGYLLSNGCAGVVFNDSTKILLDSKETNFIYVDKKGHDKQDLIQEYTMANYPKDLQKKVTLMQHFKSHLEGEDAKNKTETPKDQTGAGEEMKKLVSVYVKKWMKTKHAIMFRMNNKVVQVIFQDQTEILLSSEVKVVTYRNKKNERLHYPLSTALQSTNQEMTKRLKYTKDILSQMLGGANIIPSAGGDENKRADGMASARAYNRPSSNTPRNEILSLNNGNTMGKRSDSLTPRLEGKETLRLNSQTARPSFHNYGSNTGVEKGE